MGGRRQHLDAIGARAKALDAAIELTLHERLAEVLVDVEEDHLAIATTDADLIVSDRLDALDALSAHRLTEYKHFVFDLEALEISGLGSNEEEFLVWL